MEYQLTTRLVKIPIEPEFGLYEHQTRYDICDMQGNVIDDAQGYGYKTAQSAHKAAAYKFKGGKKKSDEAKAFWRKNKDFAKKLNYLLEVNFKDLPTNQEVIDFALENNVTDFKIEFVKHLP